MFGFGPGSFMLQADPSAGQAAELWWGLVGGLLPNPTTKLTKRHWDTLLHGHRQEEHTFVQSFQVHNSAVKVRRTRSLRHQIQRQAWTPRNQGYYVCNENNNTYSKLLPASR